MLKIVLNFLIVNLILYKILMICINLNIFLLLLKEFTQISQLHFIYIKHFFTDYGIIKIFQPNLYSPSILFLIVLYLLIIGWLQYNIIIKVNCKLIIFFLTILLFLFYIDEYIYKLSMLMFTFIFNIKINFYKFYELQSSELESNYGLYTEVYNLINLYSYLLKKEYIVLVLDFLHYFILIIWLLKKSKLKYQLSILDYYLIVFSLITLLLKIYLSPNIFTLMKILYYKFSDILDYSRPLITIEDISWEVFNFNFYTINFSIIIIIFLNIIIFLLLYYIFISINSIFQVFTFIIVVILTLINVTNCIELIINFIYLELHYLTIKICELTKYIHLQVSIIQLLTLYWEKFLHKILINIIYLIIIKNIKIIIFLLIILIINYFNNY